MRDIGMVFLMVACTLVAGGGIPTAGAASIIVALLTYIVFRLIDIQEELAALNRKQ